MRWLDLLVQILVEILPCPSIVVYTSISILGTLYTVVIELRSWNRTMTIAIVVSQRQRLALPQ